MIKEQTRTFDLRVSLAVEMNMTNTTLIPNINKVFLKKILCRLKSVKGQGKKKVLKSNTVSSFWVHISGLNFVICS